MYDYKVGRFLSVDPIIHGSGNSQGINPYSYILNNPLSGTDPTGYAPCAASRLESICDKLPPSNGGNGSNQAASNTAKMLNSKHGGSESNGASASQPLTGGDVKEMMDMLGEYQKAKQGGNYPQITGTIEPLDGNPYMGLVKSLGNLITMGIWYGDMSSEHWLNADPEDNADIEAFKDRVGLGYYATGLTPGRASGQAAQAIRSAVASRTPNEAGVIREFVTEAEQIFFRVFSGDKTVGGFLTAVKPKSSGYAQEALALPRSNTAEFIQQVVVPAGTTLRRSRAAPIRANEMFPNRRGGAEQFELLDRIPTKNFGPGSPLR
ncbi:hypothetical protein J0A66_19220 [Bowmanella dokdonensis]|uniref:RHS repeat-associated core domain-containing protein n=2 Tax=Bowmanella dokdonensis TaxID=751969 RepID=A0A939IPE8_9ALTE|nr:hypothetical protein [Bowmanella dokdonensis]